MNGDINDGLSVEGSQLKSWLDCIPEAVSRRSCAILLLLALAIGFFLNGSRPLYDSSETRYGEAAREMAVSGNWLVPHLAGKPHLTKPPLTYWILAASLKLFGKSDFVMRFPGALFFAIQPLLVFFLAETMLKDRRAAFLAGLLDATAPLLVIGGYVVTTDVYLSCFELAYMVAAWKGLEADSNRSARKWVFLFYAGIVCAFLTKGPPGLLALLALLVYCLWQKPPGRRRLLNPLALLIAVILMAAWPVVVFIRVPEASAIWKQEALTKVLISSNRDMPGILYLPIFIFGAFPATVLISWAGLKLYSNGWRPSKWMPADYRIRYLLTWIIVPMIIFIFAKTRLPLYVLPLVAPWCIIACLLTQRVPCPSTSVQPHSCGRIKIALGVWILLLLAFKCYFLINPDEAKDFQPVAAAIHADAKTAGTNPEVVLTMRVLGNGVLYYLDGPPSYRTMTEDEKEETDAGKTERLVKVFQSPVPPGHSQYIVLQSNDQVKYEDVFAPYIKPVYENREWAVWRRVSNDATTITYEKHRHRKAEKSNASDSSTSPPSTL